MIGEEKIFTIPFSSLNDFGDDMIGIQGVMYSSSIDLELDIPTGFVISTEAFDSFLLANDLVSEINSQLSQITTSSKKSQIEKVSKNISDLIKQSVIPPSIFEKISEAFENIHDENSLISIRPSWLENAYRFNGGVDKKYTFTNITNINDFENRLKMAWQAMFDPNAIFERTENNYHQGLTLAIIVQKMINAEISGRAFNFNPVTNQQGEMEIEAVFGLLDVEKELDVVPDRYLYSKAEDRVIEKNTLSQEKMLIRKGMISSSDDHEMTIEISKQWQKRPKLNDREIIKIAKILKELEAELNHNLQIEWSISLGKIFIENIKFVYGLNNFITDELSIKKEIGSIDGHKSLNQFVEEIEKEIEEFEQIPGEVREKNDDINKLAAEIIQNTETIQSYDDEQYENYTDIEQYEETSEGVWKNIKFSKQSDAVKTAIEVWLDLSSQKPRGELNSNEFDGLLGLRGEDLVQGLGLNLMHLSKNEFQIVENYFINQLYDLISQDLNKHIIYSISNLNKDQSHRFLNSEKSGIDVHLDIEKLIEHEIEAIKTIRGKKGYRKIWLGIRGIRSLEDLKKMKKLIAKYGLRRSSMLKIFLEIDKLPIFLNIEDYMKESVDGVVLYFDVILRELLGGEISQREILQNQVFWEMMDKLSKEIQKRKVAFIIKSENFGNDQILEKLLRLGINGISIVPSDLYQIRRKVSGLDLKILKKR